MSRQLLAQASRPAGLPALLRTQAAHAAAGLLPRRGLAASAPSDENKVTTAEPRQAGGQGGGQTVEGVLWENEEVPNLSKEDEQNTEGSAQKGSPASYRPPHETGGEAKEFEEVKPSPSS